MNKNKFVVLVAIFLILGASYFTFFQNSTELDSDVQKVLSEDKNLLLLFSEEVDVSDVAIEKVDADVLPEVLLGEGNSVEYVVYDLQPSGREFNEPVDFIFTQSGFDGSMPLLYHIWGENDENIELVDDTDIAIDLQEDTLTIAGAISHFSKLAVKKGTAGALQFTMNYPMEVEIGKSVPVTLDIQVSEDKFERMQKYAPLALVQKDENFSQDMSKEEYINITQGKIGESKVKNRILSPDSKEKFLRDAYIRFSPENDYSTIVDVFTCTKEGKTSFLLQGAWKFKSPVVTEDGYPRPAVTRMKSKFAITTKLFECVEPSEGMYQIDPPKVYLQAGSAPMGQKRTVDNDYLDGIEPVR